MLILIKVSSIKIPLPFMVQKSGGWRVWCLLFLTHLQLKRMHMPKWNILGWYVLIPHKCHNNYAYIMIKSTVSNSTANARSPRGIPIYQLLRGSPRARVETLLTGHWKCSSNCVVLTDYFFSFFFFNLGDLHYFKV